MNNFIGFNKPYFSGKEADYILQAVNNRKLSGDGEFTRRCHTFFENRYGFAKSLLTTSCTDALELAALLLDIKDGDEIIVPSFTFVSTVNPFILRGAKIIFIDSTAATPHFDVNLIEPLINERTKAIVPVHYAGVACEMDTLTKLATDNNLHIVEDAAQAIESYYNGKPLGSIGALAAFSFHETKNVISGEGGLLAINDSDFISRAEIIREKGTNRSAFFRGEVDKYNWVDVGSSFLPSELIAAYLFAQLECIERIQAKRLEIWNTYHQALKPLADQGRLQLPLIPSYATNNAHMYYLVTNTASERDLLIAHLKADNINAVFHYQSLHDSPYYKTRHDGRPMPNTVHYSNCLLRLPLYYELENMDVERVAQSVINFYK